MAVDTPVNHVNYFLDIRYSVKICICYRKKMSGLEYVRGKQFLFHRFWRKPDWYQPYAQLKDSGDDGISGLE
jgi:hypothetical protein